VSIEDDLETDVASLRGELLDWILTEIRSGRRRQTLAGTPLAQDLVDVVRGGLQGAVDQAIKRVEEARLDGVVEALNPTFDELSRDLRGLQASLQATIASELTDRSADADARFASLERSIIEVQRTLGAVAERSRQPRSADRTDEILREIRKLAPEREPPSRAERAPARRTAPEPAAQPAPSWNMVIGAALVAAVVAAMAGWFAHGAGPTTLTPELDVADQAHQLQVQLGDLANTGPAGGSAAAPKVDPQTIAGDVADVAAALENAANATTPDDLKKAHQQANDAIAQLRAVLEFDSAPKPSTAPAAPTPTAPAPTPPKPTQHVVRQATPAPHHTSAVAPASPSPAAPAPAAPSGGGGAPPASPGGGGGT